MLAFDVIDHAALRIVTVGGEIDGTNARAFELACYDTEGTRSIVVDLLTCPYIDSTGLTALIKASQHNALTLVLEASSRIYRIFAITDLLSYFTIASSLEAALAAQSALKAPAALAPSDVSSSFA